MTIPIKIMGGDGKGREVFVTSGNALKVYHADSSIKNQSIEELTHLKQYRDYLKTPAGSSSMVVDGSSTPVLFEEMAQEDGAKWISSWRILFHDANMEMGTNDFRRFGTAAIAPGLDNGLLFYFIQEGRRTDVFLDPVKNVGAFLDYADAYTNIVNAVSAQIDYLSFDFVFDQPVALPVGATDKIVMEVRDDLTALTRMQVVVRGWQEFV